MDLHEVAKIIAGPAPGIRLRQGSVISVQGDGTFTATIAGSTVAVSGIKAFDSVTPVPDHGIWMISDGVDLIAIGTIAGTR
jgi:hypothetical protein